MCCLSYLSFCFSINIFPFNCYHTIIFSFYHYSLSDTIIPRNKLHLLFWLRVLSFSFASYLRKLYILAAKKATQKARATGSINSDSLQTSQLQSLSHQCYVPSLRIFLNGNQSLDFSDWKHNQEDDLATIHIILNLISYSITTTEFLPLANISTLIISKWN